LTAPARGRPGLFGRVWADFGLKEGQSADINGKKGKGNFQVPPIDPLPVQ